MDNIYREERRGLKVNCQEYGLEMMVVGWELIKYLTRYVDIVVFYKMARY